MSEERKREKLKSLKELMKMRRATKVKRMMMKNNEKFLIAHNLTLKQATNEKFSFISRKLEW